MARVAYLRSGDRLVRAEVSEPSRSAKRFDLYDMLGAAFGGAVLALLALTWAIIGG